MWAMAHPTQDLMQDPDVVEISGASDRQPRSRRWSFHRAAATAAATALVSISMVGAPVAVAGLGVAPASAQTSVLDQTGQASQDSSTPQKAGSKQGGNDEDAGGGGNSDGADLDTPPDWSAPGLDQGKVLIGWAKAGAMILGVLGMIGGIVGGKVLKEAGNHHASGVRATALGIGGAMVIAGAAPTLVPALMG
jgi:hypothetical protein